MTDLFMSPDEAKTLAWIHSNKFITTKLFHRKFRPSFSFQTACNDLNSLSEEKGFLKAVKAHRNADSFYFCTRGTIHRLKEMGLILTAPEIRAPHLNTYEKEHDKRIVEMRVHIEEDEGLKNLVWLTDYEMRIGYRLEWRKALNEGRGADLKNVRLRKEIHRVPDAFFEAEINGKPWPFILEYEHSPYSKEKLNSVVHRLIRNFNSGIKLIVAPSPQRAQFLLEKIGEKIIDPTDRAAWWFCDYEKVLALPFLQTPWVDLDDYYPAMIKPAVKPKSSPVVNKAETQQKLKL